MYFEQFVKQTRPFTIFESQLVWPFYQSPQQAQRQLTDWTRAGRLLQLRRGLYAFPPPYADERPVSYVVANQLVQPSYVSLQAGLSYYGMIPEQVAVVTNVTTKRPQKLSNALGHFWYRHLKTDFFFGFRYWQVTKTQYAFIATPEKALLDLIYLTPNGDDEAYIHELRLQNLDVVDIERLHQFVTRANMPKLKRALPHLLAVIREELEKYTPL
jgi:predicted transcriptional regulator of viral defense system